MRHGIGYANYYNKISIWTSDIINNQITYSHRPIIGPMSLKKHVRLETKTKNLVKQINYNGLSLVYVRPQK